MFVQLDRAEDSEYPRFEIAARSVPLAVCSFLCRYECRLLCSDFLLWVVIRSIQYDQVFGDCRTSSCACLDRSGLPNPAGQFPHSTKNESLDEMDRHWKDSCEGLGRLPKIVSHLLFLSTGVLFVDNR